MKNIQKLIKYVAIAFAFTLILGILSSVAYSIDSIFSLFDSNDNKDMVSIDINNRVRVLDINIDKVNLKIKNDVDFKIEVSNKECISYNDDGEKLVIEEKKIKFFDKECELIIYVPEVMKFSSVFINTAAGSLYIEKLNTEELDLELGMGSVKIDYLEVGASASIDSGVGEFIVRDGSITNLELDMGVGNVSITSLLLGKNEINSGIGSLGLGLIGNKDDYKIEVDKGMGSIKLDGVEANGDSVYGTGSNYIDIDGGVGEMVVNYID